MPPPARSTEPPIDYKQLVTRWTTEVWNHRREEVIDEMMAPDCVIEVEGSDRSLTREDFKAYRRAFLSAVPDLRVEILSITTEGPRSVQSWRRPAPTWAPGSAFLRQGAGWSSPD